MNRDPIGEKTPVEQYFMPIEPYSNEKALHVFCGNNSIVNFDILGLAAQSRAFQTFIDVDFSDQGTGHNRTGVLIGIFAGWDSGRDGKTCPCIKPLFAQIVSITSHNLVNGLVNAGDGRWRMDGNPFYPYQTNQKRGASMVDRPGTQWFNPTTWLYSIEQDFETCSICTDKGPGKYWVISCVKWGHRVGGARRSTRYGQGRTWGRSQPSSDFIATFPTGLLGE